mgnify:CR=1 FL=1
MPAIRPLRFAPILETKKYQGCRFFGDGARDPAYRMSRRTASGISCLEKARMLFRSSITPMEIPPQTLKTAIDDADVIAAEIPWCQTGFSKVTIHQTDVVKMLFG